jgi:hypothetical protein
VNFGKLPPRTAADYAFDRRLNKPETCKMQQLFLPAFSKGASRHPPSSAGFQTCCVADFQIGRARNALATWLLKPMRR